MNPQLLHVAESQGDLFTTGQAATAGYDKWGLLGLVKANEAAHLARGLYAVCHPGEHLTSEAAHVRLARGGLLLYEDATLSGHSALAALGLPVWGADLSRAHLERPVAGEVLTQRFVIRPPLRAPRSDADVPGGEPAEREAVPEPRDSVDAAHVDLGRQVPVAVALVQHCLESGAAAGIVAADAALHQELVTMDDLTAAAALVHGWPRSSKVRTMLGHLDGRSESVGESRLRFATAVAGIPLEPQVVIRDEAGTFIARVDFVVAGTMVVVEFDGRVKYGDGGADALMAEKRREDRLRRRGYAVVRVTWADLYHVPRVLRWIRSAIASQEKVEGRRGRQVG
jgi:very-short-patch-repair endonuclease